MRHPLRTVVVVFATACAMGCGAMPDVTRAKDLGERYFDTLKGGDESALFSLYSPRFFEATPREKWQRMRAVFHEKLGDYQSHELLSWRANRMAGTADSGDYTVLVYEVTYTKHSAKETITVHAPFTGGEALIVGHDVRWDIAVD